MNPITITGGRKSGKSTALLGLYRLDPENTYILVQNYSGIDNFTRKGVEHSHVLTMNSIDRLKGLKEGTKLLIDDFDFIRISKYENHPFGIPGVQVVAITETSAE